MQIVRMIMWVALLIALVIFSINNWEPVELKIWEGLILETKIPALVMIAFLLGLIPMWLLHRGTRWSLLRRIRSLENAARTAAITPIAPNPISPDPAPEDATDESLPTTAAEANPGPEPEPVPEPEPEPNQAAAANDQTKPETP